MSNNTFKDHFSGHARLYMQYRPSYPNVLFKYLSDLVPIKALAWDCATGSGQAAIGLAAYFDKVIATDASQSQIEKAIPHKNVYYQVAPAESSGFAEQSIDLITVAQALHWFNIEAFYQEAKRILKPKGVIAIWSYQLFDINPEINTLIHYLYTDILGDFWPKERKIVEQGYQQLPFPFLEESPPAFYIEAHWNLSHLLGYLDTWSAVQRYRDKYNQDPRLLIEKELFQVWGDIEKSYNIKWPLILRVGYQKD